MAKLIKIHVQCNTKGIKTVYAPRVKVWPLRGEPQWDFDTGTVSVLQAINRSQSIIEEATAQQGK
jgi:hypothetical protein